VLGHQIVERFDTQSSHAGVEVVRKLAQLSLLLGRLCGFAVGCIRGGPRL
jgi:hypothetical protein